LQRRNMISSRLKGQKRGGKKKYLFYERGGGHPGFLTNAYESKKNLESIWIVRGKKKKKKKETEFSLNKHTIEIQRKGKFSKDYEEGERGHSPL